MDKRNVKRQQLYLNSRTMTASYKKLYENTFQIIPFQLSHNHLLISIPES